MAENSAEVGTVGKQPKSGSLYERVHGVKPGDQSTVTPVVESEWVKRAKAGRLPIKVSQPPTGDRVPKKVWGED